MFKGTILYKAWLLSLMNLWMKNILFDPSSVVVTSYLKRVSEIDNKLDWNVKLRRYKVIISLKIWFQKKSLSEMVQFQNHTN